MTKITDFPGYPVRLRVAALIERHDSIVLVFDPIYRGGCWILPGGGTELDETISQAIEREVLEETGLLVEAQQICSMREIWEPENDSIQAPATRKSFEIILACKYIAGEINISNNPSKKKDGIPRVKDCRWISIQSLTGMIDGYSLYPIEFINLYLSNKIVRIDLNDVLLPPLDSR